MNTASRHLPRLATAGALAALFLLSPAARATNYSWVATGTTGTWNTSTANWDDGVTNPTAWVNGNDAVFNGFASSTTITLGTNITATSLTTNATGGTTTINLQGSTFALDVPSITVNTTQIDMFAKLTGTHGLTLSASGSARLNLKTAADYTGDTYLNSGTYLMSDYASNVLPSTTVVNMATSSTFRLAKAGASQQIAGLVSSSTNAGTVTVTAVGYNLTLSTKASATTTFSGTISNNSTNLLYLVVNGSGTQALNGTNSFYGTTTVSGGTLSLGTNLTNNSAVTVNGGTLTSSASNINLGGGGVSMSSGSISPRSTGATGTFTLAANQNFTATGGTLSFNIGTALDQIKGSGTGSFGLSGTTTLDLTLGTGFAYTSTYQLFSGFSSGSVSGLTITGYDTANWLAALGTDGVLSFSAAPVPEPSTCALVAGAAFFGLVTLRRRCPQRE